MRPAKGVARAVAGFGLSAALLAACSSAPAAGGHVTTSTAATTTTTTSSTTTTTTTAGAGAGSIAWHACGQLRCGSLAVPVSYSDPSDGTIELALAELPAKSAHPLGDVLVNPGGPGASGVEYLQQAASSFPSALVDDFSIVSWDPRGIGGSSGVVCLPPAGIRSLIALPPAPSTPAQVAEVVAATQHFVAGCAASTPRDLLANLSTVDTARDLDRLRAALGQAKLTYLGYSYGTFLGTVYAQLFPTHVRAMVLDGAFDPSLSTVQIEQQQSAAFEVDLHDFLAWCGGPASRCGAVSTSGDPDRAFEQLMGRFEGGMTEQADLIASFGGTQTVDYGTALLGVLTGLYSPGSWPDLGTALTQAEQGNGSYLGAFADEYAGQQANGSFDDIVSANNAVACLDRPVPSGTATYEHLAAQLAVTAPDFGPSEAWGSLTCAYWPVPPTGAPFTVHAPGLVPVLVVGSTRDPATPYTWAKALTAQMPGAVLLTRTGDGHTGYQFSSCIRSWVDRYLTTLALPPAGTTCASDGSGLP